MGVSSSKVLNRLNNEFYSLRVRSNIIPLLQSYVEITHSWCTVPVLALAATVFKRAVVMARGVFNSFIVG